MTKRSTLHAAQTTARASSELRLVLGDQLNEQHSWFKTISPSITYVMMEVRSETDYVRHHIQKVIAFFLAMRTFAGRLRERGHDVEYLTFDDPRNAHSFGDNIQSIIKARSFDSFSYQEPDEYRVDVLLYELAKELVNLGLVKSTRMVSSEHFFTTRTELSEHFLGKKTRIMESFYRMMRVKHKILLNHTDASKPLGDKWNFDADNRKPFDGKITPPSPPADRSLASSVRQLEQLLKTTDVNTIGAVDADNFIWPTSRKAALSALERFVDQRLVNFGEYQDAMTVNQAFMFHSLLSFALNVKLVSPREVIEAAIYSFNLSKGKISLSATEGFVRQILGWREYMRGLYWEQMPNFAQKNFLKAKRKLPGYFWNADTKMNCVATVVGQSLTHAYAHHIQRLMITGNFALLAGIDPDEVDQWYLGIYIDAIEWVEITNTRGMSQFADGGIVATKPYCSTANYIKKMSDYCRSCYYDPGQRHSENACPFNSLYWDFYLRNRTKLENNHRIGMVYRTLDKMEAKELSKIKSKALSILSDIESL